MNLSDCTHVLYDPQGGNVSDVLHPLTGDPVYGKGTLAEAQAADPGLVRITFDDALQRCDAHARTKYCAGKARRVTAERFADMLEVLPPCKWGHRAGLEVFHVSERITGNLVDWYAIDGAGDHWHVVEVSTVKAATLAAHIARARDNG
jgi:hypothetical protein